MPKRKNQDNNIPKNNLKLNSITDHPEELHLASTSPNQDSIMESPVNPNIPSVCVEQSEKLLSKKTKTKKVNTAISKSKQLRDKKTSKPRCVANRKSRTDENKSESDMDTLANHTERTSFSESNSLHSPNIDNTNIDHEPNIDPSDGVALSSESRSTQRSEYTSIIKSDSVLVIKKHNLSVHEEESSGKKMRLCTENFLENSNIICNSDCSPTSPNSNERNSSYSSTTTVNDEGNSSVVSCDTVTTEFHSTPLNDNILSGMNKGDEKKEEDFDSDKTEPYELNTSPLPPLEVEEKTEPYEYKMSPVPPHDLGVRSFSPIPSTSKDNKVFEENDIRFQESLRVEDDDVEIIEEPVETIVVEDHSPGCVAVSETIDISSADVHCDDDVEFVGYSSIPKFSNFEIDNILSNGFGTRTESVNSDCEIIDVDSVIAESDAILRRFKRKSSKAPVATVTIPDDRSIHIDTPPLQLINLDTHCISDSQTYVDFLHSTPTSVTVSSDPVMASTTSIQVQATEQPTTIKGIIGDYFKNNVVPATSSSLDNVCSTIGNILDHMTNILGTSITRVDKESGENQTTNKPSGQNIEWSGTNDYRNRYTVVDTINIPDGPSRRRFTPPQFNINDFEVMPSLVPIEPIVVPRSCNVVAPRSCNTVAPPIQVAPIVPKPRSPDPAERGLGRSMECPICMENLGTRPLASTICGHIFCMVCIQKAVNTPGGRKCPTCRKVFNKKGQSFHPLFL